MPGGNPYPALIPGTPRKPLRVFLQAGHRDLNGNEPESNRLLLPDALRWLWRPGAVSGS